MADKLISLAELSRATPSKPARGASEQLPPGAPPTLQDLTECLMFSPGDGRIWLNGARMLLIHNSGIGALRRELIESMGLARARGIMLRTGYHCGARDAALIKERFPEADILALFAAGPIIHAIEGAVKVEPVHFEFDMNLGTYYGEFLWHHSSEDDEHIAHFGIGTEPACWMQTGYATGYTSAMVGRLILYREVECRSTGSSICRLIGKPAEEWDDAEADLADLNAEPFVSTGGRSVTAHSRNDKGALPTSLLVDPTPAQDSDMVGISSAFNAACHMLRRVAPTQATVLFTGESGVGKEMFARMLHRISPRHDEPFVAINCAAIPENLMEPELFGVERGAYTGATQSRAGRFERADGGTLFLDEIATLSLVAQGKLLRALQEGEVERVGGSRTLKVDVRVVAATNVDLRAAAQRGEFREDLFFRLNVFPIHLPPLRERKEDIPLLMTHFLHRFTQRHGRQISGFTPRTADTLLAYDFPGNIRELQNLVERGVISAPDGGAIDLAHLFTSGERLAQPMFSIGTRGQLAANPNDPPPASPTKTVAASTGSGAILELFGGKDPSRLSLQEIEDTLIDHCLGEVKGNVSEAARRLGLTRAQLSYRLSRRSSSE
ncbi:sigma-54-dependent Fis family transcriptional regulator [Pseudomonas fluorescens]|uniref:Sigma-54-dependent Fis family transcriptional regulator n=1 Tax=Pseudomonas fluorescens TaxID=294 RepID=A0A944DDE3_PSEFL|nr:sigma-54-dependent Fis family transcriptional regulator [Pseudomonas fluorescens]MBT2297558.1 sigma-54-dependent Fis family transcriptional regulator [Pseudomonas fluorescens]MBT2305756.1 sigma-54-dependent Fis family transcriptional regulator [Pseudomonas fluorescens]MBT2314221.1 sigma-54-dependent Fis family transcriptional regulator [Pseudomonas fluorescens]MBT2319287.1 sigma-54-dependent Fis family transcriptional regulator [Pseudomonas fluorescens]MBT2327497.1 sigma-54-dependent Fis fa